VSTYDPGDDELVPVIAGLLKRHVQDVRGDGPLPRLRSQEFLDAPDDVQLAVLVLLGSAWLWGRPGLPILKEASLDVHGAVPRGYWSRAAARPSHEEILRRRYPPNGDRDEWVQTGGAA
jgi:hypothetical protein